MQQSRYEAKLEGLATRKDDMLTIAEIGVDQVTMRHTRHPAFEEPPKYLRLRSQRCRGRR